MPVSPQTQALIDAALASRDAARAADKDHDGAAAASEQAVLKEAEAKDAALEAHRKAGDDAHKAIEALTAELGG
jgi:hypothetical protein